MRRLKDSRGIALILTVLIISLIVSFSLEFNTAMRSELYGAVNLRDGLRLGSIARSAFDYALAVVFEDGASERTFDSLHEAWADSKALGANSADMFEDSAFEVEINDLSGRIQINVLVDQKGEYNLQQKDLLMRFLSLEQFGLDSEEVGNIIDAIKDWLDADNEVTRFGAESAYYQTLERPYPCKNGPLESLEELLLVRGITKGLFYGTKEIPGLSRYLSIYGDGRININTADPVILKSLSMHLDGRMVEDMVAYRGDEESDLSQASWYKNVPGMSSEVSIDELITISSSHFEITSNAFQEAMRKQVRGVVERKEGTLKILSWKAE